MKRVILTTLLVLSVLGAVCQTRWVDARQLAIGGHGDWVSKTPYDRLPLSLQDTLRRALWDLGTNSSGVYVRFRTDSPDIRVHWKLRGNSSMNHMPDTGIKGVDLYFLNDKKWQYINTGKPNGVDNKSLLVGNMEPAMREYMLYLPLYEAVDSLWVGVDPRATIHKPELGYARQPIVFYGTSIMQGACASRPGMNGTSIVSRAMNREAINLGFSGNAKLDYSMAELIATIEQPHSIVLDFAPNCSAELISDKMKQFINIIRSKHPLVPIVVVEQTYFPPAELDQKAFKERSAKGVAMRAVYDGLKRGGDRNLHWVGGRDLLGEDYEAQVDALHATDLGFMRYAERLSKVLKRF